MFRIVKNQDGNSIVNLWKYGFGSKSQDENEWVFERAPEPWDIIWENMFADPRKKVRKTAAAWFLMSVILYCTTVG